MMKLNILKKIVCNGAQLLVVSFGLCFAQNSIAAENQKQFFFTNKIIEHIEASAVANFADQKVAIFFDDYNLLIENNQYNHLHNPTLNPNNLMLLKNFLLKQEQNPHQRNILENFIHELEDNERPNNLKLFVRFGYQQQTMLLPHQEPNLYNAIHEELRGVNGIYLAPKEDRIMQNNFAINICTNNSMS